MKYAVDLKDITFSYGDEAVLCIPSLQIKKGEKVFIHGPSGSGKSTLLNLISGILSPQAGSIQIEGLELNQLKPSEKDVFRGKNIGFIFQNFNLINYLTIFENIILPLKASSERMRKINEPIKEEVNRLARHLNIFDFLHKKVSDLSVGQQQRVAVARALIGNPSIIIADEPTSSLDDEVTDKFIELLLDEHKRENFTLIFVSHDKRIARYFDREIALGEINKGAL